MFDELAGGYDVAFCRYLNVKNKIIGMERRKTYGNIPASSESRMHQVIRLPMPNIRTSLTGPLRCLVSQMLLNEAQQPRMCSLFHPFKYTHTRLSWVNEPLYNSSPPAYLCSSGSPTGAGPCFADHLSKIHENDLIKTVMKTKTYAMDFSINVCLHVPSEQVNVISCIILPKSPTK